MITRVSVRYTARRARWPSITRITPIRRGCRPGRSRGWPRA